ncbi:hypothetical protein NDU88_003116 [Pleurodeles waltl]|uniref:Uncharacterized protein n=1 Tax=Pleurodeles waltl TaxID=8319 RepID=A0AAV7UB69_PLEWA|nr:hypothetical protein NDU88_003116 [Pleurodeles waltl]
MCDRCVALLKRGVIAGVGGLKLSFTLTKTLTRYSKAIERLTRLGSLKGNALGTRAHERAPSGGPDLD